ncbi:DUF397 domain-containing protein [Actinoalloteichus hymeniacidonis]|nr:DUF397 domain-containing protein [Actinoalloteichus hymeniacidonis]
MIQTDFRSLSDTGWGWRKSGRSQNTTNCIEIGRVPGFVGIRDTKDRSRGTVVVGERAFTAFLTRSKADGFRP